MTTIHDPDLSYVLMCASDDDLKLLIDILTDNGKGRISLTQNVCDQLSLAKNGAIDEKTRSLIGSELSRFGGNSLINVLRGGSGVPYREMLCDVASHVGISIESKHACSAIEMAIISKIVEQSMERMSEDDKATLFDSLGTAYRPGAGPAALSVLLASLSSSSLTAYRLSTVVASATMSGLVGRGVAMTGGATLSRGLAVLTGPVGWAITGIWTAFDLASPAYRVTVPCVIQIGHMRQKLLMDFTCSHCQAIAIVGSRFCANCGSPLPKNQSNELNT